MTNRNVQIGILPTHGVVIDGSVLQTSRLDLPGPYDATNGTVVGDSIRFAHYRQYSSFNDVINNSAFSADSDEVKIHNAGHTVVMSWGQGSYPSSAWKQAHPADSWWAAVAAGYADTQLKNMFSRVHAMNFGTPVVPVPTTTGKKLPIPGSTKKGSTPTEVILAPVSHEPNIPDTQFGSPAEFAAAMKHFHTIYDTWRGGGTKRIKTAVIISNPAKNVYAVCGKYYGIGTGNDISGASARPVDYPSWDIYYPQVEKSNGPASPGPQSGGAGNCVTFGSKFQQLNDWVYSTSAGGGHFSNTTRQGIGEIGCRIQTAKDKNGVAPDSTWPDKFWNNGTYGFTKWNQNNALSNGDHPLAWACVFAYSGLMLQDAKHDSGRTGNIDNSIIPDTTTYQATFQNGGYSLRPSFQAVRTCLVANGNETMGVSTGAVTPSAPTADTPTAGQTSTTLHYAVPVGDDSINVVKNGTATQLAKTGTSTTIYADSTKPLPQADTIGLTGNKGTDTSALSSTITVNWLPSGISPPAVASKPVVTNIGQASATFAVTPVATATLYSWFLDSNTDPTAPDFTSPTPTIAASGIVAGSHTVKCLPSNAGGYPNVSGTPTLSPASNSFTTTTAPDTHAPPTPAQPSLSDMGGDGATPTISWTAVADTVTAGETTSGMRDYPILRSLTALPETAIQVGTVPASLTTFTDEDAPQSVEGPLDVYYFVASRDNLLNTQGLSTPLLVTIPQATAGAAPVAVLDVPTQVDVGALFTASATNSTPGTGGAITGYTFDFEDGTQDDPADLTNPLRRHTFADARQYLVTLVVTDATGTKSKPVSQYVIASDPSGLTWPNTGAPKVLPGAPELADDINNPVGILDASIGSLMERVTQHDSVLAQIGDPLTPRRHAGAVYASVNPESAGSFVNLNAATLYVVRCMTINGEPFSTVKWSQTATGVSTVTNAFCAVYDVTGALVSPTGALTDISSMWMTQGEQSFDLDGGPFSPPIGADDSDDSSAITNEFFVAFYLGTVGATHPQITCGSTWMIVNLGTAASAVAPTQETIQTVPLFSTSSATVGTPLNAPASLGNLTRWNASACVVLYS